MKVEALDTYEKKNIKDAELDRIPKAGEVFEVSEERLEILKGKNEYNSVFVKEIEETAEDETKPAEEVTEIETAVKHVEAEKAVKKTTKKTTKKTK